MDFGKQDLTRMWCGYGAQVGGMIVFGFDCLCGTLYNIGDPLDRIRCCEVQSRGVTIGAGLGGGVGLVALIATGFASPQELDGWASVDTDFVFDFGIKGTAEYLKSLYEVGKAGKIVNSFGKGVAYAEDYKKTKWVVENAIKNQEFDVSKQQFIALPIPTPFPTAVQASIGKRASELAVISWHPVDLREKLRQRGNTMSPT